MDIDAPEGLETRGRRLWAAVLELHDLGPAEVVLLEEACRLTDRLDRLDRVLIGKAEMLRAVTNDEGDVRLVVDSALSEARQQANVLKQLLTSLRLPDDVTGKRPQRRAARGAYKTKAGSAKDRLRAV